MYDITALGELLIDFTQLGTSESGEAIYERNPGGAVANVLVAAANCGHKTAFIGKVGKDMHGEYLSNTLERFGVDTSGLVLSDEAFTTLAFVALSADGERTFSFARKPGADTLLRAEELNRSILDNTRIFHVGSLSLSDEPSRSATREAIKLAKRSGAMISYDPNYRAALWPSRAEAIRQIRSILPDVDIMKLSEEEAPLLVDIDDPVAAAAKLNQMGIHCAAVTMGKSGAIVSVGGEARSVPSFPASVVDTTGAGDAFWGGFLHGLLSSGLTARQITIDDAERFACWGNATAALCVQRHGAIPAMPRYDEISKLIGD